MSGKLRNRTRQHYRRSGSSPPEHLRDHILIFGDERAGLGVRTSDPKWLQADACAALQFDEIEDDEDVAVVALTHRGGLDLQAVDTGSNTRATCSDAPPKSMTMLAAGALVAFWRMNFFI